MLLINGYTGKLGRWLRLTPREGRHYWAEHLHFPVKVLKDWNLCFIHPSSRALSSAKERFHCGYDFAHKHERRLREHVLLSGNSMKIVAHSQGVAFAEGIAAYFYEEKGIQCDLLIALNGEQMAATPQCRNAILSRISLRTQGDVLTNKKDENLRLVDVSIVEKGLKSGFVKYDFFLAPKPEEIESTLYFKGRFNWRKAHIPHRDRPYSLWDAIRHGLQLHSDKQNENAYPEQSSSDLSSLIRQMDNQN